jgi:hypothetical protein
MAEGSWNDATKALVKLMPKLAFQPQLVSTMAKGADEAKPPALLMAQLEVVLVVSRQNLRVAELHGYASLSQYAKQVESAALDLISLLKREGIAASRPTQQSASI